MLNLLLVEEDNALRDRWTEHFRQSGHRVFAFTEVTPALEAAEATAFDLGIISFRDPAAATALQSRLKAKNPSCQITIVSERPRDEKYARALESGARAVLLKPLEPGALESLVERTDRTRQKKTSARPPDASALNAIIGEAPGIAQIREIIRKVASAPGTSVLITGESGTGKELVARAIHGLSRRADQPFVEVNCAAIPEHLLESELFGHERGAFTDAARMKPGLFELADRGTIFLDEIGEMNLDLQAKLLRVLDTGAIRRISGQSLLHLDVRVLTATNRNLPQEVAAGTFRNDLFHRLDVIGVHLPPLRERGDDVTLLADHFLGQFSRKFGKPRPELDDTVVERMREYAWPGNVRELMNQIERAVLLSRGGTLSPADFPLLSGGAPGPSPLVHISADQVSIDFSAGPIDLEDVEREIVSRALAAAGGNISQAARLLKIGRGALRYRMDQLRIERPASAA